MGNKYAIRSAVRNHLIQARTECEVTNKELFTEVFRMVPEWLPDQPTDMRTKDAKEFQRILLEYGKATDALLARFTR